MHIVSTAYKKAMEKQIRDRGYIQIGLGAISIEAQGSANADDNDYAYWSNTANLFTANRRNTEYATLEENFMKADGALLCMPREYAINDVGVATRYLLGDIKISFNDRYPLKGITLDFGDKYPTLFKVITEEREYTFTNDSSKFVTSNNLGNTSYVIISPITMVDGPKRLRLKNVIMGVALTYNNNEVIDSKFTEFIHPLSAEIASTKFTATISDIENEYDVDSQESFINFLEIGQQVTVAMGVTLEDGSVEWLKICDLSLQEWAASGNKFSFSASDIFADSNNKYTLGNRIYDRSAMSEIVSILDDMGLDGSQYEVDNYLSAVTLHNPIPVAPHKECLQMICNATRCIFYQDNNGKVIVKANFALVLEPEDVEVATQGTEARWSKPENVLVGSHYVYSDFTNNFLKADGSQYIMPESDNYLETGYVSKEVSNAEGFFTVNPQISLKLEAGLTFYGVHVKFDGTAPKEMHIKTYLGDSLVSDNKYSVSENDTYITYEFTRFDRIVFEFNKAEPHSRVLVNKIAFGDFNDYKLTFNDMKSKPISKREQPIRSISVKIYTYENETDSEGNIKPKEVEDDIWYYLELATTGENLEVTNPIIHDARMAAVLCEWLENYYRNNVNYTVDYRGDARLNAADIIHMESNSVNNLQVEIQQSTLRFNGVWSGNLVMRKALRKGEE